MPGIFIDLDTKDNIGSIHADPEDLVELLSWAAYGLREHMANCDTATKEQCRNSIAVYSNYLDAKNDLIHRRIEANLAKKVQTLEIQTRRNTQSPQNSGNQQDSPKPRFNVRP